MRSKLAISLMASISRTDIWLVSGSATRVTNHTVNARRALLLVMSLIRLIHTVLYHQPEKMAKSKEDIAERQENLEKLKKQHGID